MQSVFVIVTKLIVSKINVCKEVFCNNFGRDGTRGPSEVPGWPLRDSLRAPLGSAKTFQSLSGLFPLFRLERGHLGPEAPRVAAVKKLNLVHRGKCRGFFVIFFAAIFPGN